MVKIIAAILCANLLGAIWKASAKNLIIGYYRHSKERRLIYTVGISRDNDLYMYKWNRDHEEYHPILKLASEQTLKAFNVL